MRKRQKQKNTFLHLGSIFESKFWQLKISIWPIFSTDESAFNKLLRNSHDDRTPGKSADLHVLYVALMTSVRDRPLSFI